MNPIVQPVVWFVLGCALGWLACRWHNARRERKRSAAVAGRVEPQAIAPAEPAPSEPIADPPASIPSRIIDVGAARAAGFNLRHASDLTAIEGIGPKIEELLRTHGTDSFAKIASLGVDDLRRILEWGGPGFRFADPQSWPQQAALASQNRWAELKRMHEEMIFAGDPTAALIASRESREKADPPRLPD